MSPSCYGMVSWCDFICYIYEHEISNNLLCATINLSQISLCISAVWSEPLLVT